MPVKAPRVCSAPVCPHLTPTTRCPTHTSEQNKAWKVPERQKLYASKRWRMLRLQVLREQPWCQTEGCTNLATDVDHIVALRDGGDPYNREGLRALCKKHHSEKTAREVWGRK